MSQAVTEITTVSISRETHELARRKKRGGQTWDDLIRQMAEQYDPDG